MKIVEQLLQAKNDGISIEQFEQNLPQNLAEIQRLLKEKRYEPSPVLRVLIPKDNDKMRKLGIPTVRDRVVQQALNNVLEPFFEEIFLLLRYADDIVIFCKFESDAEDALKRAKEILEGELKLKLSTEKTKIINARKKGVEFLGFHFNGRWKRPRNKARKRFREEIRRRTRRQQMKNLEMVIKSINPVIRGWGNYFKCGTVKKSFGELDGYAGRKLHTGNPSVQFDEEVEAGRPLLYSTSV